MIEEDLWGRVLFRAQRRVEDDELHVGHMNTIIQFWSPAADVAAAERAYRFATSVASDNLQVQTVATDSSATIYVSRRSRLKIYADFIHVFI